MSDLSHLILILLQASAIQRLQRREPLQFSERREGERNDGCAAARAQYTPFWGPSSPLSAARCPLQSLPVKSRCMSCVTLLSPQYRCTKCSPASSDSHQPLIDLTYVHCCRCKHRCCQGAVTAGCNGLKSPRAGRCISCKVRRNPTSCLHAFPAKLRR